ncbi:hypothetical protein POM88_049215 [Heracleum sosnowskyi]|uniref:Uncharacterized protein n=1 Tax=Heracleum sosnowskyi TaxID=360622 RepID=A0AAD8GWI8_9APIA|nr:hypothetical protein POM88_049215 [Heracleum sosnowskyi]
MFFWLLKMLCQKILKELKRLSESRDHKLIDIWTICLNNAFVDISDWCRTFLPRSYVCPSFYWACKEPKAREVAIHMYNCLFEVFADTYSRQEVLGSIVTHIGSGSTSEVDSALDVMIPLASKYSQEMLPLSSHVSVVVGQISAALELTRKTDQVGSPNLKYKMMGLIGTMKMVYFLADVNISLNLSSSQGFAVGNGNTDPASQYKAYTDFALDNKLIAITDYQRINKKIPECEKDIKLCATKGNNACLHAYKACRGIYDSILDITGNINDYDIRKECKGAHCYDFSRMDTFLNLPSVKEALGVHTDFISCSDTVKSAMSTDRMKDLEVGIPELLEDGIKWMCKSQKSNPRKEFDVVYITLSSSVTLCSE